MPFVNVGQENSSDIYLYYEDHGRGKPVVMIHRFPYSGHAWEKEERELLAAGCRVITYDRRGFGNSSQPSIGYDYDTFVSDLNVLMEKLNLMDTMLVGHSMGTGEVSHYLGTYGSARVRKAVLVSPIPPFLLKTNDNPQGLDRSLFDGFMKQIIADRPAFIKFFTDNFYNVDVFRGTRISDQAWQASFNVGVSASAKGTLDCVPSWLTDFREDVKKLDVPVMVIQGTEDRILPIDATGRRLRGMIKDLKYVEIEGGPHGILWTHADKVNPELMDFIGQKM